MKQKYKGIICIVTSAFFFALMNMFVRMAGDLPVFQKSFFRNLVAVVFALIVLMKDKPKIKMDKVSWMGIILRSFFGTVGVLCNFYAVDHMMLADASILNKLAPFFALLMGVLILKEKITPFQVSAVVVAFMGALLVIKPGSGIVNTAAILGVLGGCAAGTAYTMVRFLGKRGVAGPFIVFFFSAFSCVTIAPLMLANYKPMTTSQLLCLLMAGLTAAAAQFAVTAAYCYAPAREISVFDYSQIIFAAVLGFFVFHQIPDLWSWIGYGIIMLTALANFWYNNHHAESFQPAKAVK